MVILTYILQGVLLKRHRVPKNDLFKGADREYWHWTDLNIGAELALYGRKVLISTSKHLDLIRI